MSEKKVNYEQEEAMVDMVGRAQAGKVVVPVSEEIATPVCGLARNDSGCDDGEWACNDSGCDDGEWACNDSGCDEAAACGCGEEPCRCDRPSPSNVADCADRGRAREAEEEAARKAKAEYEAKRNEERRELKKHRRKQTLGMIAKVLGCLLAIAALVLMLLDTRAVPVVTYVGIVIVVAVGTVTVDRWLLGFR